MSERFELSFRNKEVRVWFYIMVPMAVAGIFILLFAEYKYQYVASLLTLTAWVIFLRGVFFIKRKRRKK